MASEIISLTEFKAKAAQVIAEIKEREHTVVLTQNGRAAVVVQDYEAHQRLQWEVRGASSTDTTSESCSSFPC